jgi:hypothetical protein
VILNFQKYVDKKTRDIDSVFLNILLFVCISAGVKRMDEKLNILNNSK